MDKNEAATNDLIRRLNLLGYVVKCYDHPMNALPDGRMFTMKAYPWHPYMFFELENYFGDKENAIFLMGIYTDGTVESIRYARASELR